MVPNIIPETILNALNICIKAVYFALFFSEIRLIVMMSIMTSMFPVPIS
jgi:hypothetical protein